MIRFFIAFVAVVSVAVLSIIALEAAQDPVEPPHAVRLKAVPQETVRGHGEAPGSSFEGLRRYEQLMTLIAVQQRAAEVPPAESRPPTDVPAHSPAPETSGPSAGGLSVDWDAVAQCETGGDWSMSGSSFSGGVGFANSSWSAYGGDEFASNAGSASREQQIVVAERIRADNGGRLKGAWGCWEPGGIG